MRILFNWLSERSLSIRSSASVKKGGAAILFSLVTLLTACGAVSDPEKTLSLEDLTKIKQVYQVSTSPDGQHHAYVVSKPREIYKDEDGSNWSELYVVDSEGNARPYITGKNNVGSISWSHDGEYIYYLAKRGDDKHTKLYRIPLMGGESQPYVEHSSSVGRYSISDDGSKMVFIASDKKDPTDKKLAKKGFKAEVYEEDLTARHLWMVDLSSEQREPSKIAIDGHIVDAVISPSGDRVLAQVSPTSLIDDIYMEKTLAVYDLQGKQLSKVNRVGKLGDAIWSPNGEQIAYIGAVDMHDPSEGRLFVVSSKGGDPRELLPNLQAHVRGIEWLNNDTIAYIAHVGAEAELNTISVAGGEVTNLVEQGLGVLGGLTISKNAKVGAMVVHTPEHPREVYQVSFVDSKVTRLTTSNDWLADKQLAKQEVMKYKARDGLDLEGVLVYPLDYKEGKSYPLIMFVHGGPEAHVSNGWVSRYSSPVHYAAKEGYFSFFPNYRGSTGRGVEFSKMGQADYAAAEFDDIVDAKSHMVEKGMVDPKRVGITGGSYGGYASAWGATALTEHYAASVMFVGISNQISKFGTTDIPNEMFNVHSRNWPWDKWQWMLERSPIYHVEKARTPILIMHGKEDTRVHPSQSMELYRYLKTLGNVPVRLVFYPGEGHGNRKVGAQLDYSMRLMRWMDHYLMAGKDGIPEYQLGHAERMKQANGADEE